MGGGLWKNTGQISSGVHHVFGVCVAMGQLQAAIDAGRQEEDEGRGFAPRFVAAAGHIDPRKWPGASTVDYCRLVGMAALVSMMSMIPDR